MNNKLTDKGWQDMIQHLDREMPVNKRRKYPIIWFSTGLMVLGVVMIWSLFHHSNEKQTPLPDSKTDQQTLPLLTADKKAEATNTVDLDPKNKINNNSGKELTLNNKNSQNSKLNPIQTFETLNTVASQNLNQSVKSIRINENNISDNTLLIRYPANKNSNLFLNTSNSESNPTSSENIDERQKHKNISKLPEIHSEHLLSLYPYRSEHIFITLPSLKYRKKTSDENTLFNRWTAYALAGIGSSNASLLGAGINYNLVRHEDKALTVSLGANLYRNNTQTAINLADAENSGIEPDQIITTGWEPSTGAPQPITLSLQNMAEFEAGIFYHQKLTRKWFANAGISGIYRSHFDDGVSQGRAGSTLFNTLDSSSPLYNKLYNQFDIRPAVGLGLHIHKRWSVSTQYTFGLTPLNKFAENDSDRVFTRMCLLKMTYHL